MRPSSLLLLLPLLCQSLCKAQEQPSPITTDRPSVGTGTDVVPLHFMEFENGVSLSRSQGQNTADLPETLLRYGTTPRVELRFSTPNTEFSPGVAVARQDIQFGTKVELRSSASHWPLAFTPSLSVPTGTATLTSGGWDPSSTLSLSHSFSSRLSSFASSTLSSVTLPATKQRYFLMQNAADLGWAVNDKQAIYGEFAPLYDAHQGAAGYTVDAGGTWVPSRNLQLDAKIGVTREAGTSTLFISLGYSIRRNMFSLRRLIQ